MRPGLVLNGTGRRLVVRLVLLTADPDTGILHRLVGVVHHVHDLTGGAGGHQRPQSALAHQGPAALAVADESDHVDSRFGELGEGELLVDAPQGGLGKGDRLLEVGHQAVEVDVGIGRALVFAIEVAGVDLEHLHQQRRHVLDVQLQLHRLVGLEVGLVGEGEIDVDAFLELAESFRRQLRRPLLGIAQSQGDLGLGEELTQVCLVDKGLELARRIGGDEEVFQVAAPAARRCE